MPRHILVPACMALAVLKSSLVFAETSSSLYHLAITLTKQEKQHVSWFLRKEGVAAEIQRQLAAAPNLNLGMTKNGEESFDFHWYEVLSGTESEVQTTANGNILIDGCRYQSCPEKGFVIASSQHEPVFGILAYRFDDSDTNWDGILVVYSSGVQTGTGLAPEFKEDINYWLQQKELPRASIKILGPS